MGHLCGLCRVPIGLKMGSSCGLFSSRVSVGYESKIIGFMSSYR